MSSEEILFPEVTVGNITIKPWSFGMLFEISDSLQALLAELEKKDLINLIDNVVTSEYISYVDITKLFTVVGPYLKKIMAKTLSVEEETLDNLDMEVGIKIAAIIFKQNKTTLKNALTPLLPKIQEKEEEQIEEQVEENQES